MPSKPANHDSAGRPDSPAVKDHTPGENAHGPAANHARGQTQPDPIIVGLKRRWGRRRRRAVAFGLVVAAVALLTTFLNGRFPGLGGGDGNGELGVVSTNGANGAQNGSAKGPARPSPRDVLRVRIDGEEYQIEEDTDRGQRYRPVELAELVKMAQAARGDEQGIRVRIVRRASSIHRAEVRLMQALEEAGLKRDRDYHLSSEIAP